jgi:hypothetical protein
MRVPVNEPKSRPRIARPARPTAALFEPLGHYVWRGASGRRFTHAVYSLIGCPAPLAASYVLVRRSDDGRRRVVACGRTVSEAASLNLASIRQRGASLGANEVHIHALGDSDSERAVTAFDIGAAHGLLGAPLGSSATARTH